MDLELARLSHAELVVRGEVALDAEKPQGEAGTLAEDGIRFPERLRVDGTARKEGEVVVLAGRITGELELECSRCLGRFRRPVDVAFETRHAPAAAAPAHGREAGSRKAAGGDDDGHRIDPDELDVSFLPRGATTLSVDDVVREQVLLDLPFRWLCREECAGLCSRCGKDLNEGPCECPAEDPARADVRLSPLLELRKKLERQ